MTKDDKNMTENNKRYIGVFGQEKRQGIDDVIL